MGGGVQNYWTFEKENSLKPIMGVSTSGPGQNPLKVQTSVRIRLFSPAKLNVVFKKG